MHLTRVRPDGTLITTKTQLQVFVIPAKTGIQVFLVMLLDSRLRGSDYI